MATRITRDEMLMEVAHAIAKRGTCSRLQVGAVFSRDGRIVSTGYNGAPAGMPHCTHEEFTWPTYQELSQAGKWTYPQWLIDFLNNRNNFPPGEPPRGGTHFSYDGKTITMSYSTNQAVASPGCEIAEHAERNAIAWAARHGLALEGTEIHVTHMPCLACSRTLINAGVTKVTYAEPYRLREGILLLAEAGVELYDMSRPEGRQKIDPRFHK